MANADPLTETNRLGQLQSSENVDQCAGSFSLDRLSSVISLPHSHLPSVTKGDNAFFTSISSVKHLSSYAIHQSGDTFITTTI